MTSSQHNEHGPRPLIFGEVLYDNFPDGSSVLGGAPFNVAWHLQGFELTPLLVTRVGADAAGDAALARMQGWGMDTQGVQRDPMHPTGTVEVSMDTGQPSFRILPEQAYDHIGADGIAPLLNEADATLLYHGTLAARGDVSRNTLHRLRERLALPTFVDINLRPPWWQRDEVEWALEGARWVKLNKDELRVITRDCRDPTTASRELLHRYPIETLFVTLGAQGALLLAQGKLYNCAAGALTDLVDSVGAGDAFSAVVLLGLARGWQPAKLLEHAVDFATAICQRRGATVFDAGFYRDFLQKWED